MGTLSRPVSDLHTKYHRPPDRSSDLLCAKLHHPIKCIYTNYG